MTGWKSWVILAGAVIAAGGCAHHRRAPEMAPTTNVRATEPARPNVLQRTGAAAWDVVSAPVRLIAPGKKPAAKQQEPETYEPAEAVIMMPPDRVMEEQATARGAAATQPAGK